MAKKMMEMDGLHSDTVDGYLDYINQHTDDRYIRNTVLGFKAFYKS